MKQNNTFLSHPMTRIIAILIVQAFLATSMSLTDAFAGPYDTRVVQEAGQNLAAGSQLQKVLAAAQVKYAEKTGESVDLSDQIQDATRKIVDSTTTNLEQNIQNFVGLYQGQNPDAGLQEAWGKFAEVKDKGQDELIQDAALLQEAQKAMDAFFLEINRALGINRLLYSGATPISVQTDEQRALIQALTYYEYRIRQKTVRDSRDIGEELRGRQDFSDNPEYIRSKIELLKGFSRELLEELGTKEQEQELEVKNQPSAEEDNDSDDEPFNAEAPVEQRANKSPSFINRVFSFFRTASVRILTRSDTSSTNATQPEDVARVLYGQNDDDGSNSETGSSSGDEQAEQELLNDLRSLLQGLEQRVSAVMFAAEEAVDFSLNRRAEVLLERIDVEKTFPDQLGYDDLLSEVEDIEQAAENFEQLQTEILQNNSLNQTQFVQFADLMLTYGLMSLEQIEAFDIENRRASDLVEVLQRQVQTMRLITIDQEYQENFENIQNAFLDNVSNVVASLGADVQKNQQELQSVMTSFGQLQEYFEVWQRVTQIKQALEKKQAELEEIGIDFPIDLDVSKLQQEELNARNLKSVQSALKELALNASKTLIAMNDAQRKKTIRLGQRTLRQRIVDRWRNFFSRESQTDLSEQEEQTVINVGLAFAKQVVQLTEQVQALSFPQASLYEGFERSKEDVLSRLKALEGVKAGQKLQGESLESIVQSVEDLEQQYRQIQTNEARQAAVLAEIADKEEREWLQRVLAVINQYNPQETFDLEDYAGLDTANERYGRQAEYLSLSSEVVQETLEEWGVGEKEIAFFLAEVSKHQDLVQSIVDPDSEGVSDLARSFGPQARMGSLIKSFDNLQRYAKILQGYAQVREAFDQYTEDLQAVGKGDAQVGIADNLSFEGVYNLFLERSFDEGTVLRAERLARDVARSARSVKRSVDRVLKEEKATRKALHRELASLISRSESLRSFYADNEFETGDLEAFLSEMTAYQQNVGQNERTDDRIHNPNFKDSVDGFEQKFSEFDKLRAERSRRDFGRNALSLAGGIALIASVVSLAIFVIPGLGGFGLLLAINGSLVLGLSGLTFLASGAFLFVERRVNKEQVLILLQEEYDEVLKSVDVFQKNPQTAKAPDWQKAQQLNARLIIIASQNKVDLEVYYEKLFAMLRLQLESNQYEVFPKIEEALAKVNKDKPQSTDQFELSQQLVALADRLRLMSNLPQYTQNALKLYQTAIRLEGDADKRLDIQKKAIAMIERSNASTETKLARIDAIHRAGETSFQGKLSSAKMRVLRQKAEDASTQASEKYDIYSQIIRNGNPDAIQAADMLNYLPLVLQRINKASLWESRFRGDFDAALRDLAYFARSREKGAENLLPSMAEALLKASANLNAERRAHVHQSVKAILGQEAYQAARTRYQETLDQFKTADMVKSYRDSLAAALSRSGIDSRQVDVDKVLGDLSLEDLYSHLRIHEELLANSDYSQGAKYALEDAIGRLLLSQALQGLSSENLLSMFSNLPNGARLAEDYQEYQKSGPTDQQKENYLQSVIREVLMQQTREQAADSQTRSQTLKDFYDLPVTKALKSKETVREVASGAAQRSAQLSEDFATHALRMLLIPAIGYALVFGFLLLSPISLSGLALVIAIAVPALFSYIILLDQRRILVRRNQGAVIDAQQKLVEQRKRDLESFLAVAFVSTVLGALISLAPLGAAFAWIGGLTLGAQAAMVLAVIAVLALVLAIAVYGSSWPVHRLWNQHFGKSGYQQSQVNQEEGSLGELLGHIAGSSARSLTEAKSLQALALGQVVNDLDMSKDVLQEQTWRDVRSEYELRIQEERSNSVFQGLDFGKFGQTPYILSFDTPLATALSLLVLFSVVTLPALLLRRYRQNRSEYAKEMVDEQALATWMNQATAKGLESLKPELDQLSELVRMRHEDQRRFGTDLKVIKEKNPKRHEQLEKRQALEEQLRAELSQKLSSEWSNSKNISFDRLQAATNRNVENVQLKDVALIDQSLQNLEFELEQQFAARFLRAASRIGQFVLRALRLNIRSEEAAVESEELIQLRLNHVALRQQWKTAQAAIANTSSQEWLDLQSKLDQLNDIEQLQERLERFQRAENRWRSQNVVASVLIFAASFSLIAAFGFPFVLGLLGASVILPVKMVIVLGVVVLTLTVSAQLGIRLAPRIHPYQLQLSKFEMRRTRKAHVAINDLQMQIDKRKSLVNKEHGLNYSSKKISMSREKQAQSLGSLVQTRFLPVWAVFSAAVLAGILTVLLSSGAAALIFASNAPFLLGGLALAGVFASLGFALRWRGQLLEGRSQTESLAQSYNRKIYAASAVSMLLMGLAMWSGSWALVGIGAFVMAALLSLAVRKFASQMLQGVANQELLKQQNGQARITAQELEYEQIVQGQSSLREPLDIRYSPLLKQHLILPALVSMAVLLFTGFSAIGLLGFTGLALGATAHVSLLAVGLAMLALSLVNWMRVQNQLKQERAGSLSVQTPLFKNMALQFSARALSAGLLAAAFALPVMLAGVSLAIMVPSLLTFVALTLALRYRDSLKHLPRSLLALNGLSVGLFALNAVLLLSGASFAPFVLVPSALFMVFSLWRSLRYEDPKEASLALKNANKGLKVFSSLGTLSFVMTLIMLISSASPAVMLIPVALPLGLALTVAAIVSFTGKNSSDSRLFFGRLVFMSAFTAVSLIFVLPTFGVAIPMLPALAIIAMGLLSLSLGWRLKTSNLPSLSKRLLAPMLVLAPVILGSFLLGASGMLISGFASAGIFVALLSFVLNMGASGLNNPQYRNAHRTAAFGSLAAGIGFVLAGFLSSGFLGISGLGALPLIPGIFLIVALVSVMLVAILAFARGAFPAPGQLSLSQKEQEQIEAERSSLVQKLQAQKRRDLYVGGALGILLGVFAIAFGAAGSITGLFVLSSLFALLMVAMLYNRLFYRDRFAALYREVSVEQNLANATVPAQLEAEDLLAELKEGEYKSYVGNARTLEGVEFDTLTLDARSQSMAKQWLEDSTRVWTANLQGQSLEQMSALDRFLADEGVRLEVAQKDISALQENVRKVWLAQNGQTTEKQALDLAYEQVSQAMQNFDARAVNAQSRDFQVRSREAIRQMNERRQSHLLEPDAILEVLEEDLKEALADKSSEQKLSGASMEQLWQYFAYWKSLNLEDLAGYEVFGESETLSKKTALRLRVESIQNQVQNEILLRMSISTFLEDKFRSRSDVAALIEVWNAYGEQVFAQNDGSWQKVIDEFWVDAMGISEFSMDTENARFILSSLSESRAENLPLEQVGALLGTVRSELAEQENENEYVKTLEDRQAWLEARLLSLAWAEFQNQTVDQGLLSFTVSSARQEALVTEAEKIREGKVSDLSTYRLAELQHMASLDQIDAITKEIQARLKDQPYLLRSWQAQVAEQARNLASLKQASEKAEAQFQENEKQWIERVRTQSDLKRLRDLERQKNQRAQEFKDASARFERVWLDPMNQAFAEVNVSQEIAEISSKQATLKADSKQKLDNQWQDAHQALVRLRKEIKTAQKQRTQGGANALQMRILDQKIADLKAQEKVVQIEIEEILARAKGLEQRPIDKDQLNSQLKAAVALFEDLNLEALRNGIQEKRQKEQDSVQEYIDDLNKRDAPTLNLIQSNLDAMQDVHTDVQKLEDQLSLLKDARKALKDKTQNARLAGLRFKSFNRLEEEQFDRLEHQAELRLNVLKEERQGLQKEIDEALKPAADTKIAGNLIRKMNNMDWKDKIPAQKTSLHVLALKSLKESAAFQADQTLSSMHVALKAADLNLWGKIVADYQTTLESLKNSSDQDSQSARQKVENMRMLVEQVWRTLPLSSRSDFDFKDLKNYFDRLASDAFKELSSKKNSFERDSFKQEYDADIAIIEGVVGQDLEQLFGEVVGSSSRGSQFKQDVLKAARNNLRKALVQKYPNGRPKQDDAEGQKAMAQFIRDHMQSESFQREFIERATLSKLSEAQVARLNLTPEQRRNIQEIEGSENSSLDDIETMMKTLTQLKGQISEQEAKKLEIHLMGQALRNPSLYGSDFTRLMNMLSRSISQDAALRSVNAQFFKNLAEQLSSLSLSQTELQTLNQLISSHAPQNSPAVVALEQKRKEMFKSQKANKPGAKAGLQEMINYVQAFGSSMPKAEYQAFLTQMYESMKSLEEPQVILNNWSQLTTFFDLKLREMDAFLEDWGQKALQSDMVELSAQILRTLQEEEFDHPAREVVVKEAKDLLGGTSKDILERMPALLILENVSLRDRGGIQGDMKNLLDALSEGVSRKTINLGDLLKTPGLISILQEESLRAEPQMRTLVLRLAEHVTQEYSEQGQDSFNATELRVHAHIFERYAARQTQLDSTQKAQFYRKFAQGAYALRAQKLLADPSVPVLEYVARQFLEDTDKYKKELRARRDQFESLLGQRAAQEPSVLSRDVQAAQDLFVATQMSLMRSFESLAYDTIDEVLNSEEGNTTLKGARNDDRRYSKRKELAERLKSLVDSLWQEQLEQIYLESYQTELDVADNAQAALSNVTRALSEDVMVGRRDLLAKKVGESLAKESQQTLEAFALQVKQEEKSYAEDRSREVASGGIEETTFMDVDTYQWLNERLSFYRRASSLTYDQYRQNLASQSPGYMAVDEALEALESNKEEFDKKQLSPQAKQDFLKNYTNAWHNTLKIAYADKQADWSKRYREVQSALVKPEQRESAERTLGELKTELEDFASRAEGQVQTKVSTVLPELYSLLESVRQLSAANNVEAVRELEENRQLKEFAEQALRDLVQTAFNSEAVQESLNQRLEGLQGFDRSDRKTDLETSFYNSNKESLINQAIARVQSLQGLNAKQTQVQSLLQGLQIQRDVQSFLQASSSGTNLAITTAQVNELKRQLSERGGLEDWLQGKVGTQSLDVIEWEDATITTATIDSVRRSLNDVEGEIPLLQLDAQFNAFLNNLGLQPVDEVKVLGDVQLGFMARNIDGQIVMSKTAMQQPEVYKLRLLKEEAFEAGSTFEGQGLNPVIDREVMSNAVSLQGFSLGQLQEIVNTDKKLFDELMENVQTEAELADLTLDAALQIDQAHNDIINRARVNRLAHMVAVKKTQMELVANQYWDQMQGTSLDGMSRRLLDRLPSDRTFNNVADVWNYIRTDDPNKVGLHWELLSELWNLIDKQYTEADLSVPTLVEKSADDSGFRFVTQAPGSLEQKIIDAVSASIMVAMSA